MSDLSWLNPTPHAIAVYASQPLSPAATQHSLPSGRYSLLGPDFHRLDRASFAWRTHSFTRSRACRYSGRLWRDRSILDDPGIAIVLGLGDLRARVLSEALAAGGRKQREKSRLTGPGSVLDCPRHRSNGGFSVVERVLAAVRVGPSKTEIREYPMPDVPDDAALMKMEVAGICGTDVKLYKTPPTKSPVIMGHEN